MSDTKGGLDNTQTSKPRSSAASKRPKRGGALPNPKKAKKLQEREAIAAAAGKGPASPTGMPLGGLGVEQVAEAAEGAASKFAENWRVIVAVAALLAVIMGFMWLRSEQKRKAAERAWTAYAATERSDEARDPETWARLASEHEHTAAAVFMRLREADTRVRRRAEGDLEAAKKIYADVQALQRKDVTSFLAEQGLVVIRQDEAFRTPALEPETVEGLEPLAVTGNAAPKPTDDQP